jgi:hypothetical protein
MPEAKAQQRLVRQARKRSNHTVLDGVLCPPRVSLTRMAGFAGAAGLLWLPLCLRFPGRTRSRTQIFVTFTAVEGKGRWRDSPRMAFVWTTLMADSSHPRLAVLAAPSLDGLVL